MKKILIVDDSKTVLGLISLHIETNFNSLEIVTAENLEETANILKYESDFFLALLDLNLPDAQNGEVVKFVLTYNIPVIVFSATFNKETRQKLLSYNILDYVVKSSQNFDYLTDLISFRLNYDNSSIAVLDGIKSRKRKTMLFLKRLGMNIINIDDCTNSIKVLDNNPSIKVLLITKDLQNSNAIELLKKIRHRYTKDELIIIALTNKDDLSTIEFLKSGANSFLKIPFYEEELTSVILSNLQSLSFIKKIKENANKDVLSGLFNRRYLFDEANKIFKNSKPNSISVAMIDIDYFKKVNDNYGHQVGDEAIKVVSSILIDKVVNENIIARYGGEEFCILFINENNIFDKLEDIRIDIQNKDIYLNDNDILNITISIGFTQKLDSFQNMINIADQALYEAKQNGRNQTLEQ
jgi:diguanylate cyclase (GGDEF)-like protein